MATRLSLQHLIDQRLMPIRHAPAQPSGTGAWTGPFRGLRHGHGLDFDDLRPYAEGDDMRHIDWKASARRNLTHTRLYREEKDHVLSIGLDLRTSQFTGSNELRAVTAGRLAARLCWHASRRGSRVRLFILGDSDIRSTRARAGETGALEACGLISEQFDTARRLAGSLNSPLTGGAVEESSTHDTTSMKTRSVLTRTLDGFLLNLMREGRQLGSLILISGMDDAGTGFDQQLSNLAGSRPLSAILLDDPLLRTGLPPGRYSWRHNQVIRHIALDARGSQILQQRLGEHQQRIIDRFRAQRVPLCASSDGTDNIVLALQQAGFLP